MRIIEYTLEAQEAKQMAQLTPSGMQRNNSLTNPQVRQMHWLLITLLDPQQAAANVFKRY